MPRLRFFACEGCDAVYADVAAPPECARCRESGMTELHAGSGAADYFAPAGARGD